MSGANIKIGANSSEFQKQMKEVTRELKVMQSEFGLASEKAKLFGSSTDKLKAQQAELANKLKAQTTLVDMNKQSMQKINEEISKQLTKQGDLKDKIEKANKAYTDSVSVKGKDNAETIKLKENIDKLKEEYAKNEKAIENSNRKLDNQKIKLNQTEKELLQTKKALEEVDKKLSTVKIDEFTKKLDKAKDSTKKLGDGLKNTGSNLTTKVTLPIMAAGAGAVKMASDMEESTNKVDVAFGESSNKVKEWSNTTLKSFGVAKGTALDMSSLFGDMATSMGLSTSEASKMSMSLVGLAGDLASFKNIGIQEAETALNGIFTGETESLKRLGVVMTETNLQQFAYSQGINKRISDMTEAEKVQLRYNYVVEKTKNAHGDFERTGGGAANQTRIFTESLKELGASFGQHILPVITPLITKVNEWIQGFAQLDDKSKKIILVTAGVVAIVGPLLLGLGNLILTVSSVIGVFSTASAAIATAGGVMAVLTGPIGIAVGAIIGIISVGVLLYKNWDSIKAKAGELKNSISEKFRQIKESITSPIQSAREFVGQQVDKIKGFFSNLKIDFPKIKLPHFSIKGDFGFNPPSVPKLGIDWYDKGGIFSSPQIIGVGEKRTEFVGALDDLRYLIRDELNKKKETKFSEGDLILNIDKVNINKDTDIKTFAEELDFYRRQVALGRGV